MVTPSLLAGVSLFAALEDAEIQSLATLCRLRRFRRGDVLFREGDPGSLLYILQSGHIKVTVTTAEGIETILRVEGPGECLGELALLDGAPHSATAVALDAVETLTLSRDDFLGLLDRCPAVARAVIGSLTTLVRRLTTQVQDAVATDVTARLARRLLELADRHGEPDPRGVRITLRLTQEELAQMVGVTRVCINRHLQRLIARRILTTDRDGITLLQPRKLQERVG